MNTLIPVLAAAIVAIATVAAAVIARRIPSVDRNHSKRLAVIEIAKKRLEVRDQALQLELAATENGSTEQEEAKGRARKAVQRIIFDADSWMEYLEWDSQITRVVTKQPHKLKSRPISGMDRVFYWFFILCGSVSRTIAVVAILSFIPLSWISAYDKKNFLPLLLMALLGVLSVMLMWVWRTLSQEAQKLKFPKPNVPILDQL